MLLYVHVWTPTGTMEESAAGHLQVQGGCRTSWCEPLSEFCYRLDLDDRKMQAALHFSLYFLNRTINLDTFLFLNITFFTCFIQRHNFKLRRLHDKKIFSSIDLNTTPSQQRHSPPAPHSVLGTDDYWLCSALSVTHSCTFYIPIKSDKTRLLL